MQYVTFVNQYFEKKNVQFHVQTPAEPKPDPSRMWTDGLVLRSANFLDWT